MCQNQDAQLLSDSIRGRASIYIHGHVYSHACVPVYIFVHAYMHLHRKEITYKFQASYYFKCVKRMLKLILQIGTTANDGYFPMKLRNKHIMSLKFPSSFSIENIYMLNCHVEMVVVCMLCYLLL